MIKAIGDIVCKSIKDIKAGVLLFFTSYDVMKKYKKAWKEIEVIEEIQRI
jgi:Rad3-related DNA helicase